MTWYELKLITLQKMFAAEGNNIPNDGSTADYLAGMVPTVNEALQLISTAGKYVMKKAEIAHYPADNLLGNEMKQMQPIIIQDSIEYEAEGARAAYFEFYGSGRVTISVGNDIEAKTEVLSSKTSFSPYKFLIENPNKENVKIEIFADTRSVVKNAALYADKFDSEESVQPFTERIKYDFSEMFPDFYMFDSTEIYFEGDITNDTYIQTTKLFDENGKILLLPRELPGNYTVYYRAYPEVITEDMDDEHVLNIDREVAVILPLYMASQLYKDDDNGIATSYRNEFEIALERLQMRSGLATAEEFTSESGWI